MEIERKFLVVSQDYREKATGELTIVQGFLSAEPERTVRIRIQNNEALLTIKGISNKTGTARKEWEFPIDVDAAREMLLICERPLIEKKRYLARVGKHLFEIDEFSGENEGLIIAEIELESEDEAFIKPAWLGTEVTGDIRYYNSQLIKKPFREW